MELGFKAEVGASRVEYSQAGHRWMSRMVWRRESPDCAGERPGRPHVDCLQTEAVLWSRCRGVRQLPNSVRKGCQITIEGLVTDRWRLGAAAMGSERNESRSNQ